MSAIEIAYSSELSANEEVLPHNVIVGYTDRAALPDANLERNDASWRFISLFFIPNRQRINALMEEALDAMPEECGNEL